jgi:hypothetical protein
MLLIADDVMVTMRVKADRGYQSDEGAEPKLILSRLLVFLRLPTAVYYLLLDVFIGCPSGRRGLER